MNVVKVTPEYDQKGASVRASLSKSLRFLPGARLFVLVAPSSRSGMAMQYVPSMKKPSTRDAQAKPIVGRSFSNMIVYSIPPTGAPQVVTPTAIDLFLMKDLLTSAIEGTKSMPS